MVSSQYKLVIVVRTDLRMPPGRIAAQVGHASVKAYRLCRVASPLIAESWMDEGGFKIVLKVKNAVLLNALGLKALKAELPVTFVHDFDVKRKEAISVTCMAIGPAPTEAVDALTGKLRLL